MLKDMKGRRKIIRENATVIYASRRIPLPIQEKSRIDKFFEFIAENREAVTQFKVPKLEIDVQKLNEWVQGYQNFSEYVTEANRIKDNVTRISYDDMKHHLKTTLSSVIETLDKFVLLFPFRHLKKSDAWFTILALALLDGDQFVKMKDKMIDVCDTLQSDIAIAKYGYNVTYLLIDDFAWSGTQSSQLATRLYEGLRTTLFADEIESIRDPSGRLRVIFKAKPYPIPDNTIVFIRAGAAPAAITTFENFKTNRRNAVSLKYSFSLGMAPESSVFTWCSSANFEQGHGRSASYAYTDHKVPDYTSSAISMILKTGVVCPYMFHGVRYFRSDTTQWVHPPHRFDIPGNVIQTDILYEWKNGTIEYKLTLDNGLVVLSASKELNRYDRRPFLKNGMQIRLVHVSDDYCFAFSDTACVLMSGSHDPSNLLWSADFLHKPYDGDELVVEQKVVWNELDWGKNNNMIFQLEIDGKYFKGVNFVEDKVQSQYVANIMKPSTIDMHKIDPDGVIPATALCKCFGAGFSWGREVFYKDGKIQDILKKVLELSVV